MMGLTRPHDGSNEELKSDRDPTWYWLSPTVSTAAGRAARSRSEVARCRQWPAKPIPSVKKSLEVSRAMSPAPAITGSACADGTASDEHAKPAAISTTK